MYLGTFPLEKGYSDEEPVVTLSNISSADGRLVTADAVKIGGGMGNIARSVNRSDVAFDPSTPEEEVDIEDELETLLIRNRRLRQYLRAPRSRHPVFRGISREHATGCTGPDSRKMSILHITVQTIIRTTILPAGFG